MVAIKVGGLGIITLASLLGLAVARRLGLRQRLIAASETKALRLADVRGLLRAVIIMSTSLELAIAVVLLPSFLAEGEGLGTALYHSLFYGISSFNNAGFSLHEGGVERWAGNPFVLGPLADRRLHGQPGLPGRAHGGQQPAPGRRRPARSARLEPAHPADPRDDRRSCSRWPSSGFAASSGPTRAPWAR